MWYPFLIYYRDQKLPDFCTKDGSINYTFLGIWFVILYFGTQIHDASNYVWLGMSCALLVYLIYLRVQVRQKPMLYTMLFTHFAFSVFAVIRNIFFSGQGAISLQRLALNFYRVRDNIFTGGLLGYQGIFYVASIMAAMLLIVVYGVIFLKKFSRKLEKIDGFSYFVFSTQFVGIALIFVLSFMDTNITIPQWLIWMGQASLLLHWYKQKQKIVLAIYPTILLALAVAGVLFFISPREKTWFSPISWRQRILLSADQEILKLYKQAVLNGDTEVVITQDQADRWGLLSEFEQIVIPPFMQAIGITGTHIPLLIKEK